MKKIAKILPLIFVLGVSACGKTPTPDAGSESEEQQDSEYQYTPQDISARDVSFPTELPTDSDEPTIAIHYRRNDNKYAGWGLWLWDPDGADDGEVDVFNYQDDFGVTAYYPISYIGECSNRMGIIIRKLDSWTKDYGSDLYYQFNLFTPDQYGTYHAYLYSGEGTIYSGPNKTMSDNISYCGFIDESTIKVTTSNKSNYLELYKDNELIKIVRGYNAKSITLTLPDDDPVVQITSVYKIKVTFTATETVISAPVSVTALYKTDLFDDYNYDGELGAIYSSTSTTFKVWSPVSSLIKLRIYDNGTPKYINPSLGNDEYTEYEMSKDSQGVWSKEVEGDLSAKYYTYVVTNAEFTNKEIVDPYAKSAGVDGLRGQVVNFDETNPVGWDEVEPIQYDRNELTVWETHVADVTSSDTWNGTETNRRKFLGMVEEDTTYDIDGTSYKTGFDHIVELGVNAVQILPMFDSSNDEINYSFNWGYNPLNYNVVDGLYSSNPYDGYTRINELKQVVKAFNAKGINIIMDVVYNHVNGAVNSNFDVLMPGYYYRYNSDGTLANGSGCGNETASEMYMMRKFMVDSTTFWASEYKLGGFRFDLMGLHDITTMNQLAAECKKINPAIAIWGEPWNAGSCALENANTQSAIQKNGNKYVGYGQFNDQMRDALIKGGLNGDTAMGWVTNPSKVSSEGDVRAIQKGIAGSTYNSNYEIADPNKTVNYVTCHDNYTLYDRVRKAGNTAYIQSKADFVKMAILANAVVFTSQGTSFMLGGEEMLRTKNYDSNSYQSSDAINQYDYSRLSGSIKGAGSMTFDMVYENYKALINFKQKISGLHASTCQLNVESLNGGATLKYTVSDGTDEYIVIHSNGVIDNITPSTINLEGYSVYLDTMRANNVGDTLSSSFTPVAYQTLIAVKD